MPKISKPSRMKNTLRDNWTELFKKIILKENNCAEGTVLDKKTLRWHNQIQERTLGSEGKAKAVKENFQEI